MRAEPGDTIQKGGGRSGSRRIMVRLFGLLTLAVLIGAAVVLALAWASPRWWPEVNASDPGVAESGATLENRVATELSRVRPGAQGQRPSAGWRSDEWSVTIGQSEATAWLSTRLGKWLASRDAALPDQVRSIGVDFGAGVVRLGVEIGSSGRVISVEASPEIASDGSLWIRGVSLKAGRLPVPLSVLGKPDGSGWLGEGLGKEAAAEVVRVLHGQAPVTTEPIVSLGDGRDVRMLKIDVRDGEAVVTCRTESDRGGG